MPRPPPLKLKDSLFVDEEEDKRFVSINKLDMARKKRATRLNHIEDKRLESVLKQVEHTHTLTERALKRQARLMERSLQKLEKRRDRNRPAPLLTSITEDTVMDEPPQAWKPTSPSKRERRLDWSVPYGFHTEEKGFRDHRRQPLGRWVRYPTYVDREAMSRKTTMLYGNVLPPIGYSDDDGPPQTAPLEGGRDYRRLPTWLRDPVPEPVRIPTPKGEDVIPQPSVFKSHDPLPSAMWSPDRLPTPKWL